jgi:hypothetical protein
MQDPRFRQAASAVALEAAEAAMDDEEFREASLRIVEEVDKRLLANEPERRVVLRLPRSEHEALRAEAFRREMSMNRLLRLKAMRHLPDQFIPVATWRTLEGESDGSADQNPVTIPVRRRITLDGEQFRTLVAGGVVRVGGVAIVLADVGFQVMIDSVQEALDAWEARIGGDEPGE